MAQKLQACLNISYLYGNVFYMLTNKCDCNIGSAYCYDVYGCFGNSLILKAGLSPNTIYDAYFEDHFGNLFKSVGFITGPDGILSIPLDSFPAGLISIVSENLLLYVTLADDLTPVKLSLGTDGELYDGVLLKFHGGNAEIITIQ